jgi:tape measure domain-containing protein
MADATADIKILVKDVAGVTRSIDRIEKKLAQMGRTSAAASRQMVAANKRAQSSFDQLSLGIRNVTRVAAAGAAAIYGFGVAIREISKIQTIRLQLEAVSKGSEDFANNLELVRAVSLNTGTSFKENATILARYTRALERYGGTAEHAAIVIDTLNKAFLVNGTTGSEATSVLVQLSQALTAGALSGDEFRSFAENAGSLVDGLAETMGVTVQELKKLGAQGKITADILIKTAVRMNKEFTDAFEKTGELPLTNALENLRTEFEYVITKNETLQAAFASLGGFLVRIGGLFLEFADLLTSLPFDSAAAKSDDMGSSLELLGNIIYQSANALVLFTKLLIRGFQSAGQVVTYIAGSIGRTFEGMIRNIKSAADFVVQTWENVKLKAKDPLLFNYSKAQKRNIDKFKTDAQGTINELNALGDAAFNTLTARLDEISGEILNDIGQATANMLGESTNKFKDNIIARLRDSLGALNSPAAQAEIDKAAQKLAEKMAAAQKKFDEALAQSRQKTAEANINLGAVGVSQEQQDQIQRAIDLMRELQEIQSSEFTKEQQAALEAEAIARYNINTELARSVDFLKQSAEWLDEVKKKNDEATERLNKAWENVGLTIANALGSVIDKSASAAEALRELLKQLLVVIAQAAILKALGAPGSFGSILSGLVGGGTLSAGGGSGAGPTVRVFNYGTAPGGVQTRTRPDGSVDVVLGQLAASLATGGNVLDTTLRRTYGIRRQGV